MYILQRIKIFQRVLSLLNSPQNGSFFNTWTRTLDWCSFFHEITKEDQAYKLKLTTSCVLPSYIAYSNKSDHVKLLLKTLIKCQAGKICCFI